MRGRPSFGLVFCPFILFILNSPIKSGGASRCTRLKLGACHLFCSGDGPEEQNRQREVKLTFQMDQMAPSRLAVTWKWELAELKPGVLRTCL